MALPLFEMLRHRQAKPLSLVLSIDASRAGAALVEFAPVGKPVVRFSSEAQFLSGQTPSAPQLLSAVLEKLGQALATARDFGVRTAADPVAPAAVRDVAVFVGAPWCDSSVKRLCVAKETPMTLGQRGLDRIIERNDFALKLDGALDEKVLARAAANGYPVDNPVGLRARNFELTLFLAAIEPALKDGVRGAVGRAFPGVKKIAFASQARALFDVVRNLYPHDGHTLVLDVGGELVEIVRLDGDDLAAVGSAPAGVSSAVREVADRCALSLDAATAALRAHAETGEDCGAGISPAVAETLRRWGDSLARASSISGAEPPSRVVVSSDVQLAPAARRVAALALPGAEVSALSPRVFEPLITADTAAHPTTLACALALHSRRRAGN